MIGGIINRDAVISDCGVFRYLLTRTFSIGTGICLFVLLNPSKADALIDDPSCRRCMGFAASWGFAELWMANAFAFRATEPKALRTAADPVGPECDAWLRKAAARADRVVIGWGGHGAYLDRDKAVLQLLHEVGVPIHHLGLTGAGQPKHPLYLRADTCPQMWETV